MKNPEISRIIAMVQNTYDGAAWHGSSILEILKKVSTEEAFMESRHVHRICELVQHITAWRIFAINRLEGKSNYEVTQKENWKTIRDQDEAAWSEIKDDLAKSQDNLVLALEKFSDEKLVDLVEGKAFNYYTLIHGVIQHDLYHLGEIALLSRELGQ